MGVQGISPAGVQGVSPCLSLYGPLAFLPSGLFRLMDTLTGMSINQQPEISIIENLFKVKSQS